MLNIAGYKFIPLTHIELLKLDLLAQGSQLALKGTILLSCEGININLAGEPSNVRAMQSWLKTDDRLADINFHETYSRTQPFGRLKVKLKKEIITFCQPTVDPHVTRAPAISPEVFKQWLDEKRNITLMDTRNQYEVELGTFKGAVHFNIKNFVAFSSAISGIEKVQPIIMFCTGGIRCEKAALHLLQQGHAEVYQLEGGILGYFAKIGGAHYDGDCFVFDDRGSLDSQLNPKSADHANLQDCPSSLSG